MFKTQPTSARSLLLISPSTWNSRGQGRSLWEQAGTERSHPREELPPNHRAGKTPWEPLVKRLLCDPVGWKGSFHENPPPHPCRFIMPTDSRRPALNFCFKTGSALGIFHFVTDFIINNFRNHK